MCHCMDDNGPNCRTCSRRATAVQREIAAEIALDAREANGHRCALCRYHASANYGGTWLCATHATDVRYDAAQRSRR